MSGDFQRVPFIRSLNEAAQRKAEAALELTGRALPASVVSTNGQIVLVKFEISNTVFTLPNVTIPIVGSEYIRVPVQAGCKGIVVAVDASIGGMSGLGAATTDMAKPANLTSLVFVPIGNKGFQAATHTNHLTMYGVDGVILFNNLQGDWSLEITAQGPTLKNSGGSASLAWNPSLTAWEIKGNVVLDNDLFLNGTIKAGNGGLYTGNIHTAGTITADTDVIAGTISGKLHEHQYDAPTGPSSPANTGQPI